MKNKLTIILVLISLNFLMGLNTGDEVELAAYLTARTSPSFHKYSKNIVTTLSKGTTGEVLEIKKFPSSGNSGIKMKITSGPNTGESYWVHYNVNNPAIKIANTKDKKEITPDEIELNTSGIPVDDLLAQSTRDINATRVMDEHAIIEITKIVVKELTAEGIQKLTLPENTNCDTREVPQINVTPVLNTGESKSLTDYDETLIQTPLRESNNESLDQNPFTCLTRDHLLWSTCYNIGTKDVYVPKSFNIANDGSNKTVPKASGASRKYSFEFQGAALSDMSLLIWDSPDSTTSHGHLKLMTFFPRDVMPAIRQSDSDKDILIVTLPTQEEVLFNSRTKEIISGVLKEGPMKQTSNGAATAPDVQYSGSGVVIEASARGDFPVGFDGKSSNNRKTVTIKKKGQTTCVVPEKDLWYTDKSKGSNSFFNKDLYTNEAFDKYVKEKCGFSIY